MNKTKKIREIADKYSGEIEGYKQYAETRRASRTYTQEIASELYDRMVTYLIECKKTDTPMAVGKMCLAMGIDRKALHRMKTGEYDWRLYEYMDIAKVKGKDIQEEEDGYFKGHNPLQYWTDEKGDRILLMPYSELVAKGLAEIESDCEMRLFGNKPVGAIFYLKSVFGYSDNPDTAIGETPKQIATDAQMRRGLIDTGVYKEDDFDW